MSSQYDVGTVVVYQQRAFEPPLVVVEPSSMVPVESVDGSPTSFPDVDANRYEKDYDPADAVVEVAFRSELEQELSAWATIDVDTLPGQVDAAGIRTYAYPAGRLEEA